MKQERVVPAITLVLAGLLALAVSAGVEYVIWRLRLHAGRTFESWPVMWALTIGPLLLAALFFGLAWLAFRLREGTRPAGVLLLLLGLPATFAILLFRFGVPGLSATQVVTGDSFRFAGAFVSVLGLYLLFRPDRERS